jgi:hypothetical protein
MAVVPTQVSLRLSTDFENHTVFTPGETGVRALDQLLDGVVAWTDALAPLRSRPAEVG